MMNNISIMWPIFTRMSAVPEDDYYKKRYKTRLEKSAPIIEEFIKYVDIEIKSALPRSPLAGALEYRLKLLPSFRIFLIDGSLEIVDGNHLMHYNVIK